MSNNAYILRVRLSWAKGVWREIAILGDHTLADLHRAILDAYEWSHDDTYCFCLSDNLADKGAFIAPPDHDPGGILLEDLNLEEDQVFIYIFGEGERNRFIIKVMSIEDEESGTDYPDVVDEKGESPDQELAYLSD